MDADKYRASATERERAAHLSERFPTGRVALDVGARDGFFAKILAERFEEVWALDLVEPEIDGDKIRCVAGDVTNLTFPDRTFDFVLCAEVLEHVPEPGLYDACSELARVTRGELLVGVPFRQDIRHGCTTCAACGATNPPWGHVNSFDEARLRDLFGSMRASEVAFVGKSELGTNALSAWLMERAGNPYGTYEQDEPCTACGEAVTRPRAPTVRDRLLARIALAVRDVQCRFTPRRANWMHARFNPL